MVQKYFVQLTTFAILITSTKALNSPASGSNKFTVDSCRGNGFSVEPLENIRGFYVKADNGLKLYTAIVDNGFVVNGVDENGAKLHADVRNLEKGQAKFNAIGQDNNSTWNCKNLPAGYQVSPGIGAHKVFATKTQWNNARKICINDGGHLAVINSRVEEGILMNMLQKAGQGEALIGIHDLFTNSDCRDWVTVHGVSLKDTGYEVWSPLISPNPDNLQGKQHCLRLLKTGGMDDVECIVSRPYICEISCNDYPEDTFSSQTPSEPGVH